MEIDAPRDTGPLLEGGTMYSLKEAARLLGIEQKTLNAKLTGANITPIPDPHDRRARLITGEQLLQVWSRMQRGSHRPLAERGARRIVAERSIELEALELIRAKEEGLAVRAAHLSRREQELEARISAFALRFEALEHDLKGQIEQIRAELEERRGPASKSDDRQKTSDRNGPDGQAKAR